MTNLGDFLKDLRRTFNFASAHFIRFSPYDHVPKDEMELVKGAFDILESRCPLPDEERIAWPLAESVMREIIAQETGQDVSQERIRIHAGGLRNALAENIEEVLDDGRRVALPLPNWEGFWLHLHTSFSRPFPYTYFAARSEDEYVARFTRMARLKNIGAIVVSDPPTPLTFRLSPSAAQAIDAAAQRYGVAVILDEAHLAALPPGKRHSLAPYFSCPRVTNSTSHSLGDAAILERVSYTVLPEGVRQRHFAWNEDWRRLIGKTLSLARKYAEEPALRERAARNAAFDEAFSAYAPGDVVLARHAQQAPHTSTFLIVRLPPDIRGEEVYERAADAGIQVCAPSDFYPRAHVPRADQGYVRVSIGQMECSRIAQGALTLGSIVSDVRRDG